MTLSVPAMSAIRFGYGIRPGETLEAGPKAMLDGIRAAARQPQRVPVEGIEGRHQTILDFNAEVAELRSLEKMERRKPLRRIRQRMLGVGAKDMHARVAHAALSPHGFHERLVSFWSDHFSVSIYKQPMMSLFTGLYEAEVIRPNLAGRFADLLKAAETHPAMLIYLDQIRSTGPNSRRGQRTVDGLNENLGRELLELHSLGVNGGYVQADVRAAALLLTGLMVDNHSGETIFNRNRAEPGPIELLGKSYGSRRRSIDDIHAMLDDLAAHPATAAHISHKLAVHFVADNPPKALVDALTDSWKSTDGDLMAVYRTLLEHPDSWENPLQKARQPFDFVVASMRAVAAPESLFAMPGKDDDMADDGAVAISPALQAERKKRSERLMKNSMAGDRNSEDGGPDVDAADDQAMNKMRKRRKSGFRPPSNRLTVGALRTLGQPVWDPPSPEGIEENFDAWVSSSQITGRIELARALAGKVDSRIDPMKLLKTTLMDAARDNTIKVVSQAPSREAGIALVLASPEFNRR